MVDLSSVADVAEIVGALTVIGAGAFAVVQIRDLRRQRTDAAAIEVVRSYQSPDFVQAVRIVWDLPDGLTGDEIAARGPETENAVITVGSVFDSIGAMVYHRIVPLDVVEDITGGTLRVSWRKLRPYAEATRREAGMGKPYEWFQWLVERLEERYGSGGGQGAHVTHRDWRA
ncbi:MAG TPA: hypothetical protein VI997_00940 [Candidatus Thermoplasmatota archaeon]|nr:hypothetical protein [Candidatus Thermoplasmatota archaeon]